MGVALQRLCDVAIRRATEGKPLFGPTAQPAVGVERELLQVFRRNHAHDA